MFTYIIIKRIELTVKSKKKSLRAFNTTSYITSLVINIV